jgi:hypothetical protein
MVPAAAFVLVVLFSYVAVGNAQAIAGCGFNPLTPLCLVGKGAGAVVGAVASDAVTQLAQDVMTAVVNGLQWMSTIWVGITPPAMTDASGNASGTVQWLWSHLAVLTAALAMVSMLVGAIKIAIEEHPATHLRQLIKYLFTFALVSTASAAFVGALIYACDSMAGSLISSAIGNETFADKIGTMLGVTTQVAAPAGFAATTAVAFATVVLGVLAFFAMVVQVMIMLLRGGMLIALVGTLPAAAAASNTEIGMQWFKKQCAWVLAWAAYPLAAAVIYSAAFLLPGQGGIDALLSGLMLLLAAIVALPVLIRFLVPMTAAVSGGGGVGQIAMEGAAAAALARGLPQGAAQVSQDSAPEESASTQAGSPSGAAAAVDGGSGPPGGSDTAGGGSAGEVGLGASSNGAGASSNGGGGSSNGAGAGAGAGGAGAGAGAEGAGAAGGGAGAAVAGVQYGMQVARGVGESASSGLDDGDTPSGSSGSAGSGAASGNGFGGGSSSQMPVGDAGGPAGAGASGAGAGGVEVEGASGVSGPGGEDRAAGGPGGSGGPAGGVSGAA